MSRDITTLPILGICGWSGSGKSTLIESVLPPLIARGLKVGVKKYASHRLDVDHPGKDSDRFFQAGADVMLQSPDEGFTRFHDPQRKQAEKELVDLCNDYDLILVEGHKQFSIPKIWVMKDKDDSPPDHIPNIVLALSPELDRKVSFLKWIEEWLPRQWEKTTVYGCVLIGGKSTRMGTPKHLIYHANKTWLETIVAHLQPITEQIVIAGGGEVPTPLAHLQRLPDIPEAKGPIAGLLSAMRWAPHASWLVNACDLPLIQQKALTWLLEEREPGVWGVIPQLPQSDSIEPLAAYYDFRLVHVLEEMVSANNYRLSDLAHHPKVATPMPHCNLLPCWKNFNSQADLESIQ